MVLTTLCLAAAVAVADTEPDARPNVLLVLVDDLGWMDLGCQGNERLHTPHIDRLAREGMRFTDAYAAAPVCSPSRAAILTGLSPARLGLTNHIPDRPAFTPDGAEWLPAPTLDHLPAEHVTIAERLRDAGYATAFLGKWHLAGRSGKEGRGDERFYPERQGFERNVGGCALGGPPTYFDPYRIHNLPPRRKGEYLPDRLADETISILREHGPDGERRERPFFICLWPYAVHWPMEAPARLVEKYAERRGPGLKDPRYAAMIEALDAALGRVFAAIEEIGAARRTLVIFTSDNGGYSGVADNRPLRSGKGYLREGGIRVPLIIRWPGVVAPKSVCSVPVVGTDLFPTILEAAGVELEPDRALDGISNDGTSIDGKSIDGKSLVPLLRGAPSLEREAIYFHFPNYAWHRSNRLASAIRAGRYKLIERLDDGTIELHDLAEDPRETTDLAGQLPARAAELRAKLAAWRKETGARLPRRRSQASESSGRSVSSPVRSGRGG